MRRTALLLASMILAVLLAGGVALAATTVVEKRFSNTSQIFIADCGDWCFGESFPAKAIPYPSEITVSGFNEGRIRDVNLRLRGFSHPYPDDVGVLLVGPQGQNAVVMRSVGSTDDVRGINLTLDDEASEYIPRRQITSGTYRPTVGEYWRSSFPSPAPARPYSKALSVFDGTDPNGTWKLYVIDEGPQDFGEFGGGWSLRIRARVTV
jgi:subtilisin-like proprotein convertase family protein